MLPLLCLFQQLTSAYNELLPVSLSSRSSGNSAIVESEQHRVLTAGRGEVDISPGKLL